MWFCNLPPCRKRQDIRQSPKTAAFTGCSWSVGAEMTQDGLRKERWGTDDTDMKGQGLLMHGEQRLTNRQGPGTVGKNVSWLRQRVWTKQPLLLDGTQTINVGWYTRCQLCVCIQILVLVYKLNIKYRFWILLNASEKFYFLFCRLKLT